MFQEHLPPASLHLVMTQNETDSRAPLSPADSPGGMFCPQHLLWGSDDEWEPPKNRKGICVSGDEEGRVDREETEEAPQLRKMTRFYCREPQPPNKLTLMFRRICSVFFLQGGRKDGVK